jgi:glycosyltransferase involved in cell wall biosynthesis
MDIPEEQLIFQGWVPNEEWPRAVANFDIGLAPLAGSYDDRRSWIKVLDYAVMGVPFVCSDRAPYSGVQGGIRITNKRKNWIRAISTLIEKESTYKRLSEFGRTWGWRQGIAQHISGYLQMFEEVLKG